MWKGRWAWAWLATAAVALLMVQAAPSVRATQEWHLTLNGVSTTSGDPCGSTMLNPWDGVGDYLIGSYYDTGNTGLTFKYSYDGGSTWVTPGSGSHFGDELTPPPYYLYWFSSDGDGTPYYFPTWTDPGDTFIIRAIGGFGMLDFTCDIP